MPQSIPAGLTQEHVLRALADLDAQIDNPFRQPTGYELVHDGKRYAPKAVVGLACRYSVGRYRLASWDAGRLRAFDRPGDDRISAGRGELVVWYRP